MAKETIMLILKAAVAGRFCGKRAKLNVRFFPACVIHWLPRCPLPCVWWIAIMAVPWGLGVIFDNNCLR